MDAEAVFKRYDIRGRYPEELDEKFAERLGKAFGTFVVENDGEKVVVAKDTKESSEDLKKNFVMGLVSTGVDVLDTGTGPTDYAAFSGMKENCFSVMVTSSHMPLEFNGFKFMYPEGNGLLNEDLDKVKDIFREKDFAEDKGEIENIPTRMDRLYRSEILKLISSYENRAELRDITVVLETMGGATSKFLSDLLKEREIDLIDISEKDSPVIDPPNPKPENLDHVEEKVEEEDAYLGLATDLDGDRIAVYYDGKWLEGNQIFNILIKETRPDNIVASVDTSKQVEEMADRADADISYTRVGDPFVIDKTLEREAELSGEPNGHYCFKELVPYNSGTYAALLLATANYNDLKYMPKRHNLRESVKVQDKHEKMEEVISKVEDRYEVISEVDGVKFRVEDAEVLIRPSGSSHKLRIIVDAEEEEKFNSTLDKILGLI